MSASPPPQRAVMVDRRWLGWQSSVPEAIMNLYARVAQNDASCTEIRLSHKALGRQNYQDLLIHLAKLLEVNTTVSLFFLHQTEIATEAALAIGNMIRCNQSITALCFHRVDATYLATVLGMSLSENTHITSLALFANTFATFQAFQPLMHCLEHAQSRVTQLSLESCHLNDECLTSLWDALSTNSVLNKLDLRDMRLTESDVIQLSEALQSNVARCQIQTLLLDKNWMQDDGCAAIARWMTARRQHHRSQLEELSLAYNHIGSEGVLALAHALTVIHRDEGSKTNLQTHSTPYVLLSSLNLSGNALTAEDIANLMDALIATQPLPTPGEISLPSTPYSILTPNSILSKLSLEDCSLEDNALLLVAQALPHLGLASLNLSGHVVSKAIGYIIRQALQSTTACATLLDFQLDLADDDQKALINFYVRLNRGGRYLLGLSHYQRPQSTQSDEGQLASEGTAMREQRAVAGPVATAKSMPCSLWPLVLARLSKAQTLDEIGQSSGRSMGDNPSNSTGAESTFQADVMYYMLREKVELVQQSVMQLSSGENDLEGASSTRKRKRLT